MWAFSAIVYTIFGALTGSPTTFAAPFTMYSYIHFKNKQR